MKTDVLIVGAGVYGIGLANYLFDQKRSFIVVGKFMDLWRNHTFEQMELRSDFSTSEIAHPKNRFCADRFLDECPEFEKFRKEHLPVAVYRSYLNWVEGGLEYPVIDDLVENLDLRHNETHELMFRAVLRNGGKERSRKIIYAKKVVIAVGLSSHIYIPPEINQNRQKAIHSYETRKIEKLRSKKVLVVGGGQSAAESIEALQQRKNDVTWYSRHLPTYLEQPVNIPPWLFTAAVKSAHAFRLCPAWFRLVLVKFLAQPTIRPMYKSMLEKTKKTNLFKSSAHDNPDMNYDKVVAATGFNYDLDHFTFLSAQIKSTIEIAHRIPVLDKTFRSSCPGLYFTGGIAETHFGTALKFIIGSHYCARIISNNICE
jgi:cation diffusion facilitator CzcD-associated flavoprotein CzcO